MPGDGPRGAWFDMQASAETVEKTNLGGWDVGSVINLERALKVGDELGGHIVSGHVDGVAEIVEMRDEGDSTRFVFEAPAALAKYILVARVLARGLIFTLLGPCASRGRI